MLREIREMSIRITEIEQQSVSSFREMPDLKEASRRSDGGFGGAGTDDMEVRI